MRECLARNRRPRTKASAVGLIGARRLEPRREWRAPWIAALLLLQLSTTLLLMAAHPGSPLFSMDALVLSQFAAGTVGYLAQFVIVPFLMRYENHLVGAFWTGDARARRPTDLGCVCETGLGGEIDERSRTYLSAATLLVAALFSTLSTVFPTSADSLETRPETYESRTRLS